MLRAPVGVETLNLVGLFPQTAEFSAGICGHSERRTDSTRQTEDKQTEDKKAGLLHWDVLS